jgi:hypothetical protein
LIQSLEIVDMVYIYDWYLPNLHKLYLSGHTIIMTGKKTLYAVAYNGARMRKFCYFFFWKLRSTFYLCTTLFSLNNNNIQLYAVVPLYLRCFTLIQTRTSGNISFLVGRITCLALMFQISTTISLVGIRNFGLWYLCKKLSYTYNF